MSTNARIYVPTSLVSQFLATEKIDSRHWLQRQMEFLLDEVFDRLSSKFGDYVLSNAITGTAQHYTMDQNNEQGKYGLEGDNDQPLTIENDDASWVDRNEIEVKEEIDDSNNELITSNQYTQVALPVFASVSSEGPNKTNDEEYVLDGDVRGDEQPNQELVYGDIADDARMDSDQVEVTEQIKDTNNKLTNELQQNPALLPAPTPNVDPSNENDNDNDNGDDGLDKQQQNEHPRDGNNELNEHNEERSRPRKKPRLEINTTKQPQNLFSQTSTSNQNDEEYDIDGDNDQLQNDQLNNDIEDTAFMESDEPEIKEEFDDTNNQIFTTNQISFSSLSAPTSNEQSNHNLIKCEAEDDCDFDDCRDGIDVKEDDNDDVDYQIIEENDDVDYQIIEENDDGPSRSAKIQRMDTNESTSQQSLVPIQPPILNQTDQSDNEQTEPTEEPEKYNVQTIDRNEDKLSLTKKSPRIDTIEQSLVTRQAYGFESSNQTDQTEFNSDHNQTTDETDETNNLDKQILTIRVQCLNAGCSLRFNNRTQLKAHMSTQHNILPNRCIVKDCKQSFSTLNNLGEHINLVHRNITEWQCDKCLKYFATYRILNLHDYSHHQVGLYQCAFGDCGFTAGHRQKLFDHCKHQHKEADLHEVHIMVYERQPTEEADETNKVNKQGKQFVTLSVQCLQLDCPLMFKNKTELNLHMSTQHDILPFRCVVNDCKQSFSNQSNLGGHIAQVHSNTSQWHCDKCAKHYPTYRILHGHNYEYHQLGQYQCAFLNCAFIGKYRKKVTDHYRHHR